MTALRRLLLVGLVAAAGIPVVSGAAAPKTTPYKPALNVTSGVAVGRTETRFSISTAFGAPATADVEIIVPAGYAANLKQPTGAQLGTLNGYINDRGLTPPYQGTITAATPQSPNACDSAAGVVWTATLQNQTGSFAFTIYVQHFAGQATVLRWCLPQNAPQLSVLTFDLTGVFAQPSKGKLLWDARFTPYDPATGKVFDYQQVAALSLVLLPETVRLTASYARRTHHYTLHGRVLEDGQPVHARIVVSRSIGGGPFLSNRSGLTMSNAAGTFTLTGSLSTRRAVAFKAQAVAQPQARLRCAHDNNNVPCVDETHAIWANDSNVVTIKP